MASRTQVAAYVAEHLERDRRDAVRSAAAWLIDHGHARDARYLARDVAAELAERGYVSVRVVTARPMSSAAREQVEAYVRTRTGAGTLELETTVDPSLVGGVIVETPGRALDASVRAKLAKFVESAARAS